MMRHLLLRLLRVMPTKTMVGVVILSSLMIGDISAPWATWIVEDKPGTSGIWKRLTFLSPWPSTQNTTDVFSTGYTPGLPGTSGCCHDDGLRLCGGP